MTTIISLSARDFIAVGCDSLATTSFNLVYPDRLTAAFFESNGDLKLDVTGKPLLTNSRQIWEGSQSIPVNQLPSVTKLYDLEPMRACLLFAGTSRIGETTLRALVETFKTEESVSAAVGSYTMESLSEQFKNFVIKIYEREIPEAHFRPRMEVILSGYSTEFREPEVWRLDFEYDSEKSEFGCKIRNQLPRGQFNVVFGGQYDVIQRIVNGIDTQSWFSIRKRSVRVLDQYHDELMAKVQVTNAYCYCPG